MAVDLTGAQAFIQSSPELQAILSDPRMDYRAKTLKVNEFLSQHGFPGVSIDFKTGKAIEVTDWDPKATLPAWASLITAGMAGGAGGAFSGAGSGGVLPSTPIGTGAVSGLESFSPVGAGLGAGAAATGTAAGALGAKAASEAGGGILETLLKAAPVGAGLVHKLASGGFGGGNTGPGGQMSPELSELLALSMQRMRDQEPLFQAVTKQALGGLPTYAKQ